MVLTDQGYAVLVMVALRGPSTAYDVERALDRLAAEYWSSPHTQVYRECERLAADGLLSERRESSGRRRRIYSLTPKGRREVTAWAREPTQRSMEIRDVAHLKLLAAECSTTDDVRALARTQAEVYRRRIRDLERTRDELTGRTELRLRTLSIPMGLAVYRAALAYWEELARTPPRIPASRPRRRT